MLSGLVRFDLTKLLALCCPLDRDSARAVDSCSEPRSFPEARWRWIPRTKSTGSRKSNGRLSVPLKPRHENLVGSLAEHRQLAPCFSCLLEMQATGLETRLLMHGASPGDEIPWSFSQLRTRHVFMNMMI